MKILEFLRDFDTYLAVAEKGNSQFFKNFSLQDVTSFVTEKLTDLEAADQNMVSAILYHHYMLVRPELISVVQEQYLNKADSSLVQTFVTYCQDVSEQNSKKESEEQEERTSSPVNAADSDSSAIQDYPHLFLLSKIIGEASEVDQSDAGISVDSKTLSASYAIPSKGQEISTFYNENKEKSIPKGLLGEGSFISGLDQVLAVYVDEHVQGLMRSLTSRAVQSEVSLWGRVGDACRSVAQYSRIGLVCAAFSVPVVLQSNRQLLLRVVKKYPFFSGVTVGFGVGCCVTYTALSSEFLKPAATKNELASTERSDAEAKDAALVNGAVERF